MYHLRTTAHLHNIVEVPAEKRWAAFRAASEGGGTPPDWTQQGDDPHDWYPPSDAAGGLLLCLDDRYLTRPHCSPTTVCIAILSASQVLDLDAWEIHAAYFSSGGRGVFLARRRGYIGGGDWGIAISRNEESTRWGCSEDNVVRECGLAPLL